MVYIHGNYEWDTPSFREGGRVKRLWIPCVLCVLVMVIASSSVSATTLVHNFGTATADLLANNTVDANASDIGDWIYYLRLWEDRYGESYTFLDVEVTCVFTDNWNGAVDFEFYFNLSIEWWDMDPPQLIQEMGTDQWHLYDNSGNYGPGQGAQDTLSIEIPWMESANGYYKCILEVFIIAYAPIPVSDEDSEVWYITCGEFEPPY